MNVQSLNCQPIRPGYQLNSRPAFGHNNNIHTEDFNEEDYDFLIQEREDMKKLSANKDSKFLSSIGTLGFGIAAAAASFYTFKTMAPKGAKTLKTIYTKISNLSVVKKVTGFIKKYATQLGGKIKSMYNKIKPDSKLGKVKKFTEGKTSFVFNKTKNFVKGFTEKHNINKETIKKVATNTGATLVAIPAATTAINSSLSSNKEGGLE